jgi:eukaryotic-like serine/threonine-protein kinase
VFRAGQNGKVDAESAIQHRRKLLRFGHVAAGLGAIIWASAGIAFPLAIQIFMNTTPNYFQFLASMVICGLISAAYPFFGLTLLATKVYFPALLPFAPGTDEDDARLNVLLDQTRPYLLAAAGVPMAGVLLVVLLNKFGYESKSEQLLVLILFGLGGLGIAYYAFQLIQRALRDLIIAVHPLDITSSMTETSDALSSTV